MSRKKRASKQRKQRQQQNNRHNNQRAGKASSTLPVKGLTNLGNTCYFNAAMQILMNAPLFGEIVTESKTSDVEPILACLVKLYQDYTSTTSHHSSITPSTLIGLVRQKTGRFPRNQQADSHELLRFLLDCCKHQVIDMLFGGHFLASVVCRSCKSVSQHLEPFRDISLAIYSNGSKSNTNGNKSADYTNFHAMSNFKKNLRRLGSLTPSNIPANSVQEALARFTASELLDEANKIHCEKCDVSDKSSPAKNDETSKSCAKSKNYQIGIKSTLIAIPPPILTVHLKRFKCDASGNLSKISSDVSFDDILDISSYTSEIYRDIMKRTKDDVEVPILYSLFGVVCHSGSLRGGHYTAMVKASCHNRAKELLKFVKSKPRVRQSTLEWVYKDLETDEEENKQRQQIDELKTTPADENKSKTNNDNKTNDTDIEKPREQPDEVLQNMKTGDGNAGNSEIKKEDDTSDEGDSYAGDTNVANSSDDDVWYHISDSSVSRSNLSSALRSQAYMLFYERVSNNRIKVS